MRQILYIFILFSFVSCQKGIIIVDDVPPNTPKGAQIYITGNFNLWDPGDNRFQMKMREDSTYIVELPRTIGSVYYKFTRGDWTTVEKDRCGNEVRNRHFRFSGSDTMVHAIESWADLDPVNCDSVTIVIKDIPETTPDDEPIKIAGSFNAWSPGDDVEYLLKKDSKMDAYTVKVPRKSYQGKATNLLTYKFVREDITISEVDRFGREIEPRVLNFEKGDTVEVSIENWVDQVNPELSKVTIVLDEIPDNTPRGDDIYLTGNFNDWNPGDKAYQFEKKDNGKYILSIPRLKWGLSFKITRGSWPTEFANRCGHNQGNQNYNYDDIDTLHYSIQAWKDLPPPVADDVVFMITDVPANTPDSATLYLASGCRNWQPAVKGFAFNKTERGEYVLSVPRDNNCHEFKITRGSWLNQEVDQKGRYIENRRMENPCQDTVFINVVSWSDLNPLSAHSVYVEIENVPENTPPNARFYLVGLFNNWNPKDDQFIFNKDEKGTPYIQVPAHYLFDGFKITRGGWDRVEGNRRGRFINNRVFKGDADTLRIEIAGWEDK